MAFVRKKKIKGREYYQLVESRRVDGKPRQKVLLHLGRNESVDAALKNWSRQVKRLRRQAQNDNDEHERLYKQFGNEPRIKKVGERAERRKRQADSLEVKLKKLRELRKSGAT